MTMPLKEFSMLKGCLARTTSDNDAEALTAIRHANRIMAKSNVTWKMFFDRLVTVVQEAEPMTDELDDAFRVALDNARPGTFRDLLLDLEAKHSRGERLSERQRQVVTDAAERTAEHKR